MNLTKIREFRKRTGITQAELAGSLGVAKSTVGMWETLQHEPDISTLKKLAQIFNCTIDELLDYNADKNVQYHINALCEAGAVKFDYGGVTIVAYKHTKRKYEFYCLYCSRFRRLAVATQNKTATNGDKP